MPYMLPATPAIINAASRAVADSRDFVRPIEEVLATLGGVQRIFSYSDANDVQVGVTFL